MSTVDSTTEKAANAAAEAGVENQVSSMGIEVGESSFSMELSQDQLDIQEWAHGFAEQTVRPAAHEWDEKEEFPWPVVQEAAKIGLYGFESIAQFWADPIGLTFPIVNEELFWGDAGNRDVDLRDDARGRRDLRLGHARAAGEWVPQCFGTEDDVKVGAFCASEPDAGSDVSASRPPPSTTRPRTSGS